MAKQKTRNGLGEFDPEVLKNAIWVTEAFHFSPGMALELINSGMLGFKHNSDGTPKIDKKTNEQIPITISRATFFKYKSEKNEESEIYKRLSTFALHGYALLLVGFQKEIEYLHRLSIENLYAVKNPLERQRIIDSIVTKVIPTQSAFADILREIIMDGDLIDLMNISVDDKK